jgi:pyruvate formate lyase activating enzyme
MAETGRVFDIQKFSLHDGPGIRTVVFLKGCPLDCAWCSNPNARELCVLPMANPLRPGEFADDARDVTVDEVVATCLQDRPFYEESGGGVTLSGGEPLVQHRFATALLDRLREEGLHTAIETTGAVPEAVFRRALDRLDLVIIDVKLPDAARHQHWTGAPNTRPLRALDIAVASGLPLLVRIPVIPGVNDSLDDAAAFARLLHAHGVGRVQLLPFHQFGERKYDLLGWDYRFRGVPALHDEDLGAYRAVLAEHGVDVAD